MPRIAYSYKRFSSPKQSRGDSMRRQTEFEQRVVKEMDLVLDDSLTLSDTGVSAFRGKNAKFGALAEFMKLVDAGKVADGSVLIVENIDRLSRENVFDAFNLFSRIIGAGVTLVTAEPYDVYDKAGVQGNVAKLMVPLVYMMRAHDESKTKSERIHQAWGQRRKRAAEGGAVLTERCPAWLRVVGGCYQIIEPRAKVIRGIFKDVRGGLGAGRVVRKLVEKKVPPFGRSGAWTYSYVRKLLTWPAVCGDLQLYVQRGGGKSPEGAVVPDYYPAVVSRDDYDAARAVMAGRRNTEGRPSRGEENLFTGLLWHAGDRCRMVMRSHNAPGKRTVYVRSGECGRGKGARDGRQFPYARLEAGVLAALRELRAEDVAATDRVRQDELTDRAETLRQELFVLDARYAATEKQFLDPTVGLSPDALLKAMGDLKVARDGVLARLRAAAAEKQVAGVAEVRSVVAAMEASPPGEEREALRRRVKTRLRWLLDSIWVHIEKQNHVRQYAHVQIFFRGGGRKDLTVPSFGGEAAPPGRSYRAVDFRSAKPGE